MDSDQRVNFPPPPRQRPPVALALLTAVAVLIVVVGECLLRRDHLRPAAAGAGVLSPVGVELDAAIFCVVWLVLCFGSLCCWLACGITSDQPSRTETRWLLVWALAIVGGSALAMTASRRAGILGAQAKQRFVVIMAPTLAAAEAAAAKGQPADSLRTDAVEARLRRFLPGIGDVHVLYQTQRKRYEWPGDLVVITNSAGQVLRVLQGSTPDKAGTETWRGRPVAEIERLRGKASGSEVEFAGAWRLVVLRGDSALVHEAGQEPYEYGTGPWIRQDVCKHRLLNWEEDPERYWRAR